MTETVFHHLPALKAALVAAGGRLPGNPAAGRGDSVWTLPSGAVAQTVSGVTYYAYDSAYYRPYYSGSSVFYEVVANPA